MENTRTLVCACVRFLHLGNSEARTEKGKEGNQIERAKQKRRATNGRKQKYIDAYIYIYIHTHTEKKGKRNKNCLEMCIDEEYVQRHAHTNPY